MKRLYRSSQDKMLGGVCAGLGEYFGLDPTLIRLGTIIAVFGAGVGLLAYLVAWVLIPADPD